MLAKGNEQKYEKCYLYNRRQPWPWQCYTQTIHHSTQTVNRSEKYYNQSHSWKYLKLLHFQGPSASVEMPGLSKPDLPLKEFDKVSFTFSLTKKLLNFCHGELNIKVFILVQKNWNNSFSQAELKERLTPTQYLVTQEHQTEKYAKYIKRLSKI